MTADKPNTEKTYKELAIRLAEKDALANKYARENQLLRAGILHGLEPPSDFVQPSAAATDLYRLRLLLSKYGLTGEPIGLVENVLKNLAWATSLLRQLPEKPGIKISAALTKLIDSELTRRNLT